MMTVVREVVKLPVGICPKYITLLNGIPAKGRYSRMRTRFINILEERIRLADNELQQVVADYVMIIDGQPATTINEFGSQVYQFEDDEKRSKYIEESSEIKAEYTVIEGENNRLMLEDVFHLLENSDVEYVGEQASLYDQLCLAFEVEEYEQASPVE